MERKEKRLIALALAERLAVLKQQWTVMYQFGLVTSGVGDKVAEIAMAACIPMGI